MEGASDGRALKTILPQINPRKLVSVLLVSCARLAHSPSLTGHRQRHTSSRRRPLQRLQGHQLHDRGDLHSRRWRADHCWRGDQELLRSTRRLDHGLPSHVSSTFPLSLFLSIVPHQLTPLSQVEDYDVAYVSGVIQFDPESDIPVLERTALTDAIPLSAIAPIPKDEEAGEDTEMEPVDETAVAPLQTSSVENLLPPLQPSLFIGDLRLSLLKDKLAALNVPSEFAGEGVLVCGPAPPESFGFSSATTSKVDPRKGSKAAAAAVSDEAREAAGGRVAVKKTGRGKLVIEGTPGETYFVVRRIVYSLHAAAG